MSADFARLGNDPLRLRTYPLDDDLGWNNPLNNYFFHRGFGSEEPSHVFIFTFCRAEVDSQRMHRSCPGPRRLDVDLPPSRGDAYRLRCLANNPDFARLLNGGACVAYIFNH